MKKCLFALAMLAALPAAAADSNFGVKFGQFAIDGDSSSATQVGVVYTWDVVGMLGIEGEINTSVADGAFGSVDYGVTQAGAYGVVMTPGPFYVKFKAGLMYTDVDVQAAESGVDPGYGVGVGFELLGVVMEIEYTVSDTGIDDAEFVSFAVKF